jgi:hypothetical protein
MGYKADYESLLTYINGQQPQVISLRRFLFVVLQSDLHNQNPAVCTELFTELRNRMNEALQGSVGNSACAPPGQTDLTCIINELCLDIVGCEYVFATPHDIFQPPV